MKPRSCEEKLTMLGVIVGILASATPNHRTSVATYWSDETSGMKPAAPNVVGRADAEVRIDAKPPNQRPQRLALARRDAREERVRFARVMSRPSAGCTFIVHALPNKGRAKPLLDFALVLGSKRRKCPGSTWRSGPEVAALLVV